MILDILFPKYCINCWYKWEYICNNCKKNIKIHPEICPNCWKAWNNFKICINCKYKEIYYEWIFIWFQYSWLIKKLILWLKYTHIKDYWSYLSEKIINLLYSDIIFREIIKKSNTIITNVPSHWFRKYFIKGYNQSEILSKNISNLLWIKHIEICTKIKYTKSQIKLKRKERLINLIWSF